VSDRETRYRLPRSVIPSRYDIALEPNLEAGAFTGSEDVMVRVHEPVTEVVLNAKELEVTGGSFSGATGPIEIQKFLLDADAERLTLELAEEAAPGDWTLHLEFRGSLNDRMVGFYRSVYTDDDGTEQVITTSHFEATDARMAFPCWDEPDLKAVFGVQLTVPEGLTALSNGPQVSSEPTGDGKVRVRFADTMKMSTYLVCFVVGRLELTEPRDAGGIPVRVACRPGREHLAGFALGCGVFSLNLFADYYGIPYPDSKVDHVAIPDFAQGAMENLGCITYREQLLLVDPDTSTLTERLDVAETVAHEVAHMWFGDLVTMRWWNGIWLNEAFATFMEYLAVDAMEPEWRVWDSFARQCSNALETDSLESTRPIEYPVYSPDDASGMFDTLTYSKGGALLRMLQQWLGPDRFRAGIRRYLAKHAYGNTETHDLWDAIEEETGEPVRRVMDAWIFQRGYPVITVSLDGDSIRFDQERFIPSVPGDPTTWPIPLVVRQLSAEGERVDRTLIEPGGLSLPLLASDSVVVANAGAASFVRVFYQPELGARLVGRMSDVMTPVERHSFVDDAWAAVVSGQAKASAFVDLIAGFGSETDPTVWQAIIASLSWCDRFVEGGTRERLRSAVRDLIAPALERAGWTPKPGESDLDREMRGELIRAMGILGDDPAVQDQARQAEAEWSAMVEMDAAVAAASIDVVAHAGDAGDYERYWDLVLNGPTPQEQARRRQALTRFRQPELMARTLAATLSDGIRPQDAPFVLARSLANRDLGAQAWAFVADNWDDITDRIAPSNVISIPAGARYITDPALVPQIQAFFEEHDIPQNHMMLVQFMERQRVFAALRTRASEDLVSKFGV
jgi:puromycin-sensitive aminopeptidase